MGDEEMRQRQSSLFRSERQRTEDKVKRIVRLETGSHYWWRQKHERIWRVCYIGNDPDDNQWLHPIGSPPMKVADMDLSCFDWQEINQPTLRVSGPCPPDRSYE